MHRDNWDDLRFVLAVAREGTVSGASRVLGVNHATVLRRIAAFEARAGIELFDRTPRGYDVPHDRGRVIEAAREVEAAVQLVERMLRGAGAPLSGDVRVTSTDTFCQTVLPAVITELRREAPELRIELICSNNLTDFARSEADITVRPAERLPVDLAGEVAARLEFCAYAPVGQTDAAWLGLSGGLGRSIAGKWMLANVAPEDLCGAADSFLVLREMVAAEMGAAILPTLLARGDPRIVAMPGRAPPMSVPVWVASHTDLADMPRVAQVRQLLRRSLAARATEIQGGV